MDQKNQKGHLCLSHFPSGWPQKGPNFPYATKMVCTKPIDSGSKLRTGLHMHSGHLDLHAKRGQNRDDMSCGRCIKNACDMLHVCHDSPTQEKHSTINQYLENLVGPPGCAQASGSHQSAFRHILSRGQCALQNGVLTRTVALFVAHRANIDPISARARCGLFFILLAVWRLPCQFATRALLQQWP